MHLKFCILYIKLAFVVTHGPINFFLFPRISLSCATYFSHSGADPSHELTCKWPKVIMEIINSAMYYNKHLQELIKMNGVLLGGLSAVF